jgi:hypothetical protein
MKDVVDDIEMIECIKARCCVDGLSSGICIHK